MRNFNKKNSDASGTNMIVGKKKKKKKNIYIYIVSTYSNVHYVYTYSNGALEDVYKFSDENSQCTWIA